MPACSGDDTERAAIVAAILHLQIGPRVAAPDEVKGGEIGVREERVNMNFGGSFTQAAGSAGRMQRLD